MNVKHLKEMLDKLNPEDVIIMDEDGDMAFYKSRKAYENDELMLGYINMEIDRLRLWDAEKRDFV